MTTPTEPPGGTPLFAIVTCGLEQVAASEIGSVPGVSVLEVLYRRVRFRCAAPLQPLLQLSTVDDVFLEAGGWSGIGRERSALKAMEQMALQLDLEQHLSAICGLRDVSDRQFALSVSFVGRRNYNTDEIKKVLAAGIQKTHGWSYCPRDLQADINVRLFMEHEEGLVGLRLAKRPLHQRSYKISHLPGSLKPTVAAAMVRLAGVRRGDSVVDISCGAGTIVIEAALAGASALGGDVDLTPLKASAANISAAGLAVPLCRWDMRRLPVHDAHAGHVVCNLPWGVQVPVCNPEELYRDVCIEVQRVLSPGRSAVLLTDMPELLHLTGLKEQQRMQISVFGLRPWVVVYVKAGPDLHSNGGAGLRVG